MEQAHGDNLISALPITDGRVAVACGAASNRRTIVLRWALKSFYALTAGVFCAAIGSYAPVGGAPIAQYVPVRSTLFIHAPSGAALHRVIRNNAAFKELLDDPDTAAFIATLSKPKTLEMSSNPNKNSASDAATPSLGAQFDAEYSKLPWPVPLLIPPNENGFYPLAGGECAIALVPAGELDYAGNEHDGKLVRTQSPGILIFTRVFGSTGHVARLAGLFFHAAKNVRIFDLGGGLVAIGLNGARPEFGPHVPPAIAASGPAMEPGGERIAAALLQLSFSPPPPEPASKDLPIDAGNSVIARLIEEGVPESVLNALQRPPGIFEILNWNPPPSSIRIDFFAGVNGGFFGRGRIEGPVPALLPPANPDALKIAEAARKARHGNPFVDFQPNRPKAEFVLPVDARSYYLYNIEKDMRLSNGAKSLSKKQRQWASRYRLLAEDGADLDTLLWPYIGHVAVFEIEDRPPVFGLPPYHAKAWLPANATNTDALLALQYGAAQFARLNWVYVHSDGDRILTTGKYVKRFQFGDEDRYVLGNRQAFAPAWGVGPKGLRFTFDADAFALQKGPLDSDLPNPPEALDAYRVRVDGPRLASAVEWQMLDHFEDEDSEIVPRKIVAQKVMAEAAERKANIRLAKKAVCTLGKFVLEIIPDAGGATSKGLSSGAEVRLDWMPGSIAASAPFLTSGIVEKDDEMPQTPNADDLKKGTKSPDDDDVPPPPPPPGN